MALPLATTCLLLVAMPRSAGAQEPVTLDAALAEAHAQHPDLIAGRADVAAQTGLLRAAGQFPTNPEVSFLGGPSRAPDTAYSNVEIGLAQTFELGGQRGARKEAAEAFLQASELRLAYTRAVVAARVKQAFARAQIGREALETTREAEDLTVQLREAAAERLARGAGTQLELNVAAAAVARARRDRLQAESALRSAILELAVAMGRPAGVDIVPDGPALTPGPVPALEAVLARALSGRGDLAAASAEALARAGEVRLANAVRWPNATLAAAVGREEDLEKAAFGISLGLPLFNRNQGQRDAALAREAEATAVELGVYREVEREVLDAFQAFERAKDAEEAFGRDAVASLAENLDLARRSYEAGKLNLAEFSVFRRDLVETQLAYLDARANLLERYYALELAAGGTLTLDSEPSR